MPYFCWQSHAKLELGSYNCLAPPVLIDCHVTVTEVLLLIPNSTTGLNASKLTTVMGSVTDHQMYQMVCGPTASWDRCGEKVVSSVLLDRLDWITELVQSRIPLNMCKVFAQTCPTSHYFTNLPVAYCNLNRTIRKKMKKNLNFIIP